MYGQRSLQVLLAMCSISVKGSTQSTYVLGIFSAASISYKSPDEKIGWGWLLMVVTSLFVPLDLHMDGQACPDWSVGIRCYYCIPLWMVKPVLIGPSETVAFSAFHRLMVNFVLVS